MNKWIPITTRKITEEERRMEAERIGISAEDMLDTVYDCKLPDIGQEVLITTSWGCIALTHFCDDVYGAYFEDYEDEGEVVAWMPIPAPYKKPHSEDLNALEMEQFWHDDDLFTADPFDE